MKITVVVVHIIDYLMPTKLYLEHPLSPNSRDSAVTNPIFTNEKTEIKILYDSSHSNKNK